MNDKELLKYAAIAAGINIDLIDLCIDGDLLGWNPLVDDGDALRLAVKLRILVPTDICFAEVAFEKQCAATRRAIVRAAAEIGKNLK